MSETKLFWFHCGRCGKLFQAESGMSNERACAACGADPRTSIEDPAAASVPSSTPGTPEANAQTERQVKHIKRKPKNRYLLLKLVCAWSLVLMIIIFGARKIWYADPPARAELPADTASPLSEADALLLQTAGTDCWDVLAGFLTAGTPELRNQFVFSPVATASRMVRFYSMNPLVSIQPETLRMAGSGLLHLPEGSAFEAHWEAEGGGFYDAVFRRENSEWRLDWEHFSRYSDYPWSLFLSGEGPEEGEFRLLARERLAEERKQEPTLSIVLYAPRFGSPLDPGFQSPEFLVARDGRDGQLLAAAFEMARTGGRVYGGQLKENNPEGMIRVRVKVRRTDAAEGRKFEISEVSACHWLSLNDPGVHPLPEPQSPAHGEN